MIMSWVLVIISDISSSSGKVKEVWQFLFPLLFPLAKLKTFFPCIVLDVFNLISVWSSRVGSGWGFSPLNIFNISCWIFSVILLISLITVPLNWAISSLSCSELPSSIFFSLASPTILLSASILLSGLLFKKLLSASRLACK